ncbi:FecR domain-containing protein [Bradyrhizobium liaoningense]|uniref:FecR family protein n=1 Tax=Bradyrhizobium liaoningense TaxID=43992 RepID=UPI001BA6EB65|nr:FecR family protein [Bradyrhizobium liaoningense]MBR0712948.1 FecR domain-containing protein [Bradyrhizobium liaoningense]
MLGRDGMRRALMAALLVGIGSSAFAADGGVWSVSKASGDVWIATDGAQQVSLKQEEALKPGDTIRTGRNGRVLLVRGEETILISPNSVVGLPAEKKDGLSTTIVQQAGSILLEVEKRNVKHFEVETPYLAAVVKGTQFSVTVGAGSTKVGVVRGQVEVSDFKTGQIAQVMPGQSATAFEHGKPGLSLGGAGTFNPIEQGKPRASTIERIPVPKSGLTAPRNAANGRAIHALAAIDKGSKASGLSSRSHQATGAPSSKPGVIRISGALGEVKLNVHKATHGLAHGSVTSAATRSTSSTDTVWSDTKTTTTTTASNSTGQTAASLSSSSSTSSSSSSSSSGGTTTVATSSGSSSDASGGSSGNGNGNGNSGATGNGKGNNGNGNGNGGGDGSNGHGHAYGRNKH